jgi:N-acetylglucosamine kinase-like BadF-type ATPase
MKLIIDSGTTKTHWVLLEGMQVVENFKTTGFNPYYTSSETIRQGISAELPETMRNRKVDRIFFYGTGCSTNSNCSKIETILQFFFKEAIIETHHDLFGAAVALQKNREGIAAILGTGSNSCLWNGHEIIENVPSVGWLIGDEGSATYLGKVLLKAFLGGEMSKDITQTFYDYLGLDFEGALHKIYSGHEPNRWISSLAPFASAHIDNSEVRELVKKNFRDFLSAQIKKYSHFQEKEISFTGSVAWHFQEVLREVLQEENLHPGIILQQPMDGLIEFHSDLS